MRSEKKRQSQSNNEVRSSNNGFSLSEVLIAAVILGLVLLVIYSLYVKVYEVSNRSKIKEVATALAQETMENAVNKPFANLALWAAAGTNPMPPDAALGETVIKVASGTESNYVDYQSTSSKSGITYTVTTTITWHDDDNDGTSPTDPDPNDYKRIHVAVSWPGGSGITLDRFVSFYYRPYANSTVTANAAYFQLSSASDYANLGSTTINTYTGGNKTSKAEAKGFSTNNYDSAGNVVAKVFTDDNASSASPSEDSINEKVINYPNNLAPIYLKTGFLNKARVHSSAIANIINSGWHAGEFLAGDGWPTDSNEWPSPPNWASSWQQPSAIAKSELSEGLYWNYAPDQAGIKLFETGSTLSGSKSVIVSGTSNDKIVTRSWSKISNIKLIEGGLEDGTSNPMVSIDSVEARVETETNGISGGAKINEQYWKIGGLKVGNTAPIDILAPETPSISTIAPIQSITVAADNNSSVDADGESAQAKVLALKIIINSGFTFTYNSEMVSVPSSTIILGTAQANVSYATK